MKRTRIIATVYNFELRGKDAPKSIIQKAKDAGIMDDQGQWMNLTEDELTMMDNYEAQK